MKIAIIIILMLIIPIALAQEPTIIEKTVSISRPAVVFIQLTLKGNIEYPDISKNILTIGNQTVFDTTIEPKEFIQDEVKAIYTGSGSFINPDGYVLTNAHVVSFSSEEDMRRDLTFALMDYTDNLAAITSMNITGATDDFRINMSQYLTQHTKLLDQWTEIEVMTGRRKVGEIKGVPAEIVKKGGPYPEKDIALLKTGLKNTPAVYLGDSDILDVGTSIFVMGYPGAAEISEESTLEPSVTAGIISAKKGSEQGWPLIQIDAAISGGNSGGPVFDERGEVIGIATLGSTETQGFNWIVPINLIKEYINEANIKNYHSYVDEHYLLAMKHYWNEECDRSKKELMDVLSKYPDETYALEYISHCKEIVSKKGEARERSVIVGLSSSSVLILLLLIIIFIYRGRKISKR